jgi:hypothetical protein
MSSRRRRPRAQSFCHHPGDGFMIHPKPIGSNAGPLTRSQLEKQAADLQKMGILPIPPPRVPIYSEFVGDVYDFVTTGDYVDRVCDFELNSVPPGAYRGVYMCSSGARSR